MKYAAVVYNIMMKVMSYADAVVGYDGPKVTLTHGQAYVVETTSKAEKGMVDFGVICFKVVRWMKLS
jgi:hypothetical protein